MPPPPNEPGNGAPSDGDMPAPKRYKPPTLRSFGNVRDITLTSATGPNFDGGGGANIYAS
jgi:hypothetical protein